MADNKKSVLLEGNHVTSPESLGPEDIILSEDGTRNNPHFYSKRDSAQVVSAPRDLHGVRKNEIKKCIANLSPLM